MDPLWIHNGSIMDQFMNPIHPIDLQCSKGRDVCQETCAYLDYRSQHQIHMKNQKWPLSPKRGRISEKDYLTKCDANGPLKDWPK